MKILVPCFECTTQKFMPPPLIMGDYFDDMTCRIECPNGHKSIVLLQSQKFEALLESGANALLDGFTLEASATFYTAFERFIEFCLHILFIKRGMTHEQFESMFAEMSRQSERQLGAFIYIYTIETGKKFSIQPKITEFRNKLIHKGEIPTKEKAFDFCERIYKEIISIFGIIKSTCSDEISNIIGYELQKRKNKVPADVRVITSSGTMFFNVVHIGLEQNFNIALEKYKEVRKRFFQSNLSI